MKNAKEWLQDKPYPGRGIVFAINPQNNAAYIAYFIMGRSENSRNRVFVSTADGIVTQAANPAKLQDPSLILYTPVRRLGTCTIVGNGDQTDTIFETLRTGGSFEDALRARTFEPDTPHYTPRISGLLTRSGNGFSYKLSLLRANTGGAGPQRFFWEYPQPLPGRGHLLHTYQNEGEPLPSFAGEPRELAAEETLEAFSGNIWQGLNTENRISLFARSITLSGEEHSLITNKY